MINTTGTVPPITIKIMENVSIGIPIERNKEYNTVKTKCKNEERFKNFAALTLDLDLDMEHRHVSRVRSLGKSNVLEVVALIHNFCGHFSAELEG